MKRLPRWARDDAEPTAIDGPLAKHLPDNLVQVADAGPADVTAPRALAGIEMTLVARGAAAVAAGKAFHPLVLHFARFGMRFAVVEPSNE